MAKRPAFYGTLPAIVSSPERRFPTSLDKIRLFCPFGVADHFDNFTVYGQFELGSSVQTGISHQDVPLFKHRGVDIHGVFALWRDGCLRVRIGTPFERNAKHKPVFCWLTFNPSQFLFGFNTRPLTKRDLVEVLHQVQERLNEQGLLIDIYNAKLSQIDLCRDIALPRNIDAYWPLLHGMDAANNARGSNFKSGLWRGNKSTRWCIYDKTREVQAKSRRRGVDSQEALRFLPGPFVMRLERRLRDAETVKREAKTETVGQLLYSYNSLSGLLDDRLLQGFLRELEPTSCALQPSLLPSGRINASDRWVVMLQAASVQELHLKNLLAIQGYEQLIRVMGWNMADSLLWASFKAHGQASTLSKLRKKFRQWRLTYGLSEHGIPYAQLYAEVYRATFALATDDIKRQDEAIAATLPVQPLRRIRRARRIAKTGKKPG